MKVTKNYQLKLPESGDVLSLTPFNENAQVIDTALQANAQKITENAQTISASLRDAMQAVDAVRQENVQSVQAVQREMSGRAMVACGTYSGDGTRSRTIQTTGFKPQVVLMRTARTIRGGNDQYIGMEVWDGWCLWLGEDMAVSYDVYATSQETGTLAREDVNTTIHFDATNGALTWSIPALPKKYSNVREDSGPLVVNNAVGRTYQWVALGTAQT